MSVIARAWPATTWTIPYSRIVQVASVGALAWFVGQSVAVAHPGDAWAYYSADLNDLYQRWDVRTVTYAYPPPFAQFIEPLRSLPYAAFYLVLLTADVAALAWMVGLPWAAVAVWMAPFELSQELLNANINLLLAAAIVASFRWQGWWSFALFTKITPVIGLLWYAVRGEWRPLLVAIGVTTGLIGLSAVISPQAWVEYVGFVHDSFASAGEAVQVPWSLRVALAIVIIGWAGVTNRRWPVLIAVTMALPIPHPSVAIGAIALARWEWRLRLRELDDSVQGHGIAVGPSDRRVVG